MKVDAADYPFDLFDTDFDAWWRSQIRQNRTYATDKEEVYAQKRKWIDEWLALSRTVIPSGHTVCAMETKQQYRYFTMDEIHHTLTVLGEMAGMMYQADRDIFPDSLKPNYDAAMHWIVCMVATFVDISKHSSNFTDLTTRMKQLMEMSQR